MPCSLVPGTAARPGLRAARLSCEAMRPVRVGQAQVVAEPCAVGDVQPGQRDRGVGPQVMPGREGQRAELVRGHVTVGVGVVGDVAAAARQDRPVAGPRSPDTERQVERRAGPQRRHHGRGRHLRRELLGGGDRRRRSRPPRRPGPEAHRTHVRPRRPRPPPSPRPGRRRSPRTATPASVRPGASAPPGPGAARPAAGGSAADGRRAGLRDGLVAALDARPLLVAPARPPVGPARLVALLLRLPRRPARRPAAARAAGAGSAGAARPGRRPRPCQHRASGVG